MAPAPSKPAIAAAPSVKIDAFGSTFLTPSTATTAPAIFSASSRNPMTISPFQMDECVLQAAENCLLEPGTSFRLQVKDTTGRLGAVCSLVEPIGTGRWVTFALAYSGYPVELAGVGTSCGFP